MLDFKSAMEEAMDIIKDTDWDAAPFAPEDVLLDTIRLHLREYLIAKKDEYAAKGNHISALTVDAMLKDLSKA